MGTDEGNVRLVVENAIATDDLTPLLRLIFHEDASPNTPSSVLATMAVPGVEEVAPSAAAVAEEHWQTVAAINACLQSVAAEQDKVIEDICRSNAKQIAQCVAEMEAMRGAVHDLVDLLQQGNGALQAAGKELVHNAHELSELVAVQQNVVSGIAVVQGAKRVLQLCLEVGGLLEQGRLYHALVLIERIKKEHLDQLLSMISSSTGARPGSTTSAGGMPTSHSASSVSAAAAPGSSPASPGDSSRTSPPKNSGANKKGTTVSAALNLQAFFQSLISELTAAVEALALSEFNSWLVAVRAVAKQIGLRAIRKAAIERGLENDLTRERRSIVTQLTAGRDLQDVASKVARAGFRQELLRDRAPEPGLPLVQVVASGPVKAQGQAIAAAAAAAGSSTEDRLKRIREKRRSAPGPTGDGGEGTGDVTPVSGVMSELDPGSLYPGQPHLALQALMEQQRQQLVSLPASANISPSSSYASLFSALSAPSAANVATQSDSSVGLLAGLDMKGLYRCIHVHKALGRITRFRDYYLEQRRLQVSTDLAPPHKFIESYQGYLGQVAGFFIVESYVERLAPEVCSADQVNLLWVSAAGTLKSTLDVALDSVVEAPIMVQVKDFVLLVCRCLESCGYAMTMIEDVLLNSRVRYHELAMSALSKDLAKLLAADSLAEYTIKSEGQLKECVKVLGLPLRLEGAKGSSAGPVTLPFLAPFSPCVPALLRSVRSYVDDSLSYLEGLCSSWELCPAVLYYRNKMMSKVVVEALQARISSAIMEGAVQGCMRMVANAWCLLQCLDTLNEWTVGQTRPLVQQQQQAMMERQGTSGVEGDEQQNPSRTRNMRVSITGDSVASNVHAALRSVQDTAERAVIHLVTQRMEAIMAGARRMNWMPNDPLPSGPSAYVHDLTSLLQETFDKAQVSMPRSSFLFLCRSIMQSICMSYNRLFAPDGVVVGYNLLAIEKLAADLAQLSAFAATCAVPDLAQDIVEPVQMCAVLLSGTVEDVLSPDVRKQKYPNLRVSTVLRALDKYRELAKVGKQKTNFPTKKAISTIAKQLRAQIAGGSGMRVLEDV